MVNFLHYPATLSEDDVIRYRRQSTRLLTEVNCPFCTEPWYFCQPRPKPLVNSHQKGLLPADFVSVNSKTNEAGDNKSNIYTLNYSREWQTESKLPDWYLGFLFFVKRPLYMNISPLFFSLDPKQKIYHHTLASPHWHAPHVCCICQKNCFKLVNIFFFFLK